MAVSLPSERAAVAGKIDPQVIGASTSVNSDWVDMRKFEEAMAVAMLGATDRTLDALVQEARDSSGTGAQTLSGKTATQLTATDDNKVVVFNVKAEELTQTPNQYTHVRLVVTSGSGGTTTSVAGVVLGKLPKHGPASDNDLTAVAQIVT